MGCYVRMEPGGREGEVGRRNEGTGRIGQVQ